MSTARIFEADNTDYNTNIRVLPKNRVISSKWVKTGNFVAWTNVYGNGVYQSVTMEQVSKGNETAWFVKAAVLSDLNNQFVEKTFSALDTVDFGKFMGIVRDWVYRNAQFMRFIVGNTVLPELKFADKEIWKPITTQFFHTNNSNVINLITLNTMQTRPYGVEG